MRNVRDIIACVALLSVSGMLRAEDKSPAPAPAPAVEKADAEGTYTRTIEKRADDILAVLKLSDSAKAARVRTTLTDQYRALKAWHDENDSKRNALRKRPKDDAEARRELDATADSLKKVHDKFIKALSVDLTEAQVEQVKDKLTYNVVHVTHHAYCEMLPTLTEAQKAHIMASLKEAREEAMEGGSSEEKHAVFGRYKGKINNYLSGEGYDLKTASKQLAERSQAAKNSTGAGETKADGK
jgi:hypothetical protein